MVCVYPLITNAGKLYCATAKIHRSSEKNANVCCLLEETGKKPIKTFRFQRLLTLKKMRRKWKILGIFDVDLEINTKACRAF